MIVILEGPKGSGKTTLARELAARFQLDYHHEGPPPPGVRTLQHYGRVLEGFRGKRVIIDRFALGERVYGPLYRGKDDLGDLGWWLVTRLMRAVNAMHVVCLPPVAACRDGLAVQRDRIPTQQEVLQLAASYKAYEDFVRHGDEHAQYPYSVYNWVEEGRFPEWGIAHPFLRRVARHDERLSKDPRNKVMPSGVLGYSTAKVMLVGARGSDQTASVDLPFWSDENSSEYLHRAVSLAGISEDNLALVNAYRHDGRYQEIPRLQHTVALGAVAADRLRIEGMSHARIPHPQYWKRFHNNDIVGYARQLRTAVGLL